MRRASIAVITAKPEEEEICWQQVRMKRKTGGFIREKLLLRFSYNRIFYSCIRKHRFPSLLR